jgi:hypothetical protein
MPENNVDVTNLSTRRLWEILRLSEIDNVHLDENLQQKIIDQLCFRKQYNENERWNAPH